jgi:hypothetical protein
MVKRKGRYFSVRFSALLLERLETARVELYGERTSLAETVRRLIEERLHEIATKTGESSRQIGYSSKYLCADGNIPLSAQRLSGSGCLLAEEIAQVAKAVDQLVQRGVELGENERSSRRSMMASPDVTDGAVAQF